MQSPIILPFRGISPKIHETAFIAPGVVIVGDVEIGAEANVWFGCILRGDMGPIRVGARTNLQDGTVLHITQGAKGTFVGEGVTVGHMSLLHECVVEDRAFIGMRATLLDGSKVEADAMLAAGSLLTQGKTVPRGQMWSGSPAKYWREVKPEEHESFVSRAAEYVELAKNYKN